MMIGEEDELNQRGGTETAPPINHRTSGGGDGNGHVNLAKDGGVEGSASSSATSSPSSKKKAKSCKGCLYYSSTIKSKAKNPLCVGIPRSLPQVPQFIVGESAAEAYKEGRSLTDFKYACVGYSVYADRKSRPINGQQTQTELPACVGLEILLDKRPVPTNHAPANSHNPEDVGVPQPQTRPHKPPHSSGEEFLTRFYRNANLVAMGVVKNLQKVGNKIKTNVDDILNRRPK
ncbi:unnamed protein product [Cuscuta campestris]|uniref:DUF8204 domain-containing protein n=1 Tax=Cuscuta campestris TaxID=132261 RepID=A0A484NMZ0_9ASTE|nr:unnamed protein product [Cuscuta campestris]